MIDIAKEKLITLNEAAAFWPRARQGKKCHRSTVLRLVLRGRRGVKLEAVKVGAGWATSVEAIQRFFDRLTAATSAQRPLAPRKGQEKACDATLRAKGLM